MSLSDFDFYTGISADRLIRRLGIDPSSADGYNKIFWYRAEDIDVAHGAKFEYWPDAIRGSSNPSLLLAQPSGANQFKYFDGYGPNGYPVVRYSGASWMVAPAPLLPPTAPSALDFSSFVVMQKGTANNYAMHPILLQSTVNSAWKLGIWFPNNTQFSIFYPTSGRTESNVTLPNDPAVFSGTQNSGFEPRCVAYKNNMEEIVNFSATDASSTLQGAYYLLFNTNLLTGGAIATIPEAEKFDLIERLHITDFGLPQRIERVRHSAIVNYFASKYNIPLGGDAEVYGFDYTTTRGSGTTVNHSSLSNPLSFVPDGNTCLAFQNPTIDTDGYGPIVERHLLNGDGYIGLDQSYAISARAWVRIDGVVANGQCQIVLMPVLDDAWRGFDKDSFYGYGLKFGTIENDGYSTLGLRISSHDIDGYVVPGYEDLLCDGNFYENTWYRVRCDVIPLGHAADRVIAYMGVGETDNETWTEIGRTLIPSNTSGYLSRTDFSRIGYYVSSVNTLNSYETTKIYIDQFQVRVQELV